MKKTPLGLILMLAAAGLCQAQYGKVRITAFAGVNHHFEYGSVEDYEPGYNSFPVMPAHTPSNFGAAFAYFVAPWLGVEYDMRLTQRSEVKLSDPSDGDTLIVQTPKHFALTLNFVLQPTEGRVSPYLLLGAGIDRIVAMDEIYISEFGYEIIMAAPAEGERLDMLMQAGAGLDYYILENLGVQADVRVMYILDDPDNVTTVNTTFGIVVRF